MAPYLGNVPSNFNVTTNQIDNDAVTSAKIADGTILNADVNSAAAIAGTKISPDFGSQNAVTTGTSTAASFIPTSSSVPTNGVYLPAANSVAISTNGTGRLFVDASGNVGVGTAPSQRLHIVGAATTNPSILLAETSGSSLQIISGASDSFIGTNGSTPLRFGTAFTERMRLDSSGRLGLGTSSPDTNSKLHISASENTSDPFATDASVAISNYQAAGNNEAASLKFLLGTAPGTNAGSISCHYDSFSAGVNSSLRFYTVYQSGFNSPAERMRIDPQGRVGIGTTSPGYSLDVNGAAAIGVGAANGNNYEFRVRAGTTGLSRFIAADTSDAGYIDYDHSTNNWIFRTSGSEAFRVDSSQRLLVGTSSSSKNCKVVIQGSSATNSSIVRFCRADATPGANDEISALIFGDSNQTDAAYILVNRDGGTWTSGSSHPTRLTFSTTADGASSPTERMRIKSNGHLQVTTDGGFGGLDGVSHGFRTTTANWVAQFMNDQITGTNNYGVQIKYVSSAPNGTGNSFLLCGDSAADRVQLRSNGGLANYQANDVNLSDRNAKKDITPAAGTWDCIKEWEIVNYRYKDQPDDADLNLGVIAQQVAESCPEVITVFQEAKEATEDQPAQEERLGVKEQQMYWMAIKALQEAQVRIETLEAEVAALKAQ